MITWTLDVTPQWPYKVTRVVEGASFSENLAKSMEIGNWFREKGAERSIDWEFSFSDGDTYFFKDAVLAVEFKMMFCD